MTKYYYFVAEFIIGSKINFASFVQAVEGVTHFQLCECRECIANKFGCKKEDVLIINVLEITKEEAKAFRKDDNL